MSQKSPVNLFNLDLHVAVIHDVMDIFGRLYGDKVKITNWSISAHCWVFGEEPTPVEVVTAETWKMLDERMIAAFHTRYDSFLSTFDGFVVTHSPAFALLFEKYEKPIIMVNSCRYEQPFSWPDGNNRFMWPILDQALQRMWQKGQLTVVSNNRPDMLYILVGAGVPSVHIPSLCLYSKISHNPHQRELLVYGDRSCFPPSTKLVQRPKTGFTWQELYSYKAIVHVPYEISTMSIFEQLSAGVPLFFPTKRFFKHCIQTGQMRFQSRYAFPPTPKPLTSFFDSVDVWLNGADFYTRCEPYAFKFVYFYDSFSDMVEQAETFEESHDVVQARREWLEARKETVLCEWKKLLDPTLNVE